MNSDDKAHSDSESGSPHSRAAPSAHSADAIANLLRAHSSSTSTPHIGDALVLSGISGVAPIDGVALLSAALDNMPAEPNDLNQARLGLRILASAGKEQQTPSLAESQDLAKLALEIIDAVDVSPLLLTTPSRDPSVVPGVYSMLNLSSQTKIKLKFTL